MEYRLVVYAALSWPVSMRIFVFCCCLLLLGLTPLSAQAAESPLDWIPAGFDGALRVRLTDPDETLLELNMAWYVASFIQPQRVDTSRQRTLSDFFPVDLFDVEGASFEDAILPWLDGEIVVGYRRFDDRLGVADDDVLLILPTDDGFAAAAALSPIVGAQDLAERAIYRGTPIVVGDRTALAFTPSAVLVGARPLLEQALDAHAGDSERLADSAAFQATMAEAGATVSAYIDGDAALGALSVALHGDRSAEPLLAAFGNALAAYNGGAFATALLTGATDGLGITVTADGLRGNLRISAHVQTNALPPVDSAQAFDAGVLGLIPRSAMMVQSGGDARAAFYNTLLALPLTGSIGNLLGGFLAPAGQVQPTPSAPAPTADDLQAAVAGFVSGVKSSRQFDLDRELAAQLGGSYAFALLPRPNNPAPLTGAAYDLLLVTQTADAEAALEGASALAQTVFAVEANAFEDTTIGDAAFRTLFVEPIHEPLLQLGTVDDLLVVGTGAAVEQAMRAGRGDNRLVSVRRWQDVSGDDQPSLYIDLNAVYNTFFATAGGPASRGIGQLGATVRDLGAGLYVADVTVTLPAAFQGMSAGSAGNAQ